MRILTANPGSTSCKFCVVDDHDGDIVVVSRPPTVPRGPVGEWSDDAVRYADECDAVVVRVVHGGGQLTHHGFVDERSIDILRDVCPLAPNHNPASLAIVESMHRKRPELPIVLALDSAFHATMPRVATTLAVPKEWRDAVGLRRLGFHGLSHAWAARRAPQIADGRPLRRIVSCHLGGGSSLTALLDGVSIDTTMGFTPLDGLPMATRSGSLDPGAITIAMRALHLDPDGVDRALSMNAGMAGISGRSGDMLDLLAAEADGDLAAALAVDVFVHRVRAAVVSMAASLEGIDAIAFTGGIGSASSVLRRRIVDGLHWIGARLAEGRNIGDGWGEHVGAVDRVISIPHATPVVMVIESREDLEMAHIGRALLRG